MTRTMKEVNPGDILSSTDWNLMVEMVNDHETRLQGQVEDGLITVPTVFGFTLNDARAILTHPTRQLVPGNVLDSTGTVVNPNVAASLSRIVINQIPPPGFRVNPGSSVNLLVAGTSGSSTTPAVLIVEGIYPAIIPADGAAEIRGANFDPLYTNNKVTFDGVAVVPESNSTTTTLYVTVPAGISGAPTAPGQPRMNNVEVKVAVGSQAGTTVCSIDPPTGIARPKITAVDPALPDGGIVNQPLTITGSGFSATVTENQVTFDGVAAAITSASTTQLKVTIPSSIPGLTQIGNSRTDVPIIITVKGVPSGGPAPLPSPFIYTVTKL